jgi:HTH-type transcriptional regulator / antitoxin HigA
MRTTVSVVEMGTASRMCFQTSRQDGGHYVTYVELVEKYKVEPIETNKEYERLYQIADDFSERPTLRAAEEKFLTLILVLLRDFRERELRKKDAGVVLQMLMLEEGINQTELSRETGIPQSRISELLTGKRDISRRNAAKLGEYFGLSPQCFDPVYQTE